MNPRRPAKRPQTRCENCQGAHNLAPHVVETLFGPQLVVLCASCTRVMVAPAVAR